MRGQEQRAQASRKSTLKTEEEKWERNNKGEKYRIQGRVKGNRYLKEMSNHLEGEGEKISKSTERD